jgi:hypothetical protein
MAIYSRSITTSETEPASPHLGDWWICPAGDGYQPYIYLNAWIPLPGGGVYQAESNVDKHYINTLVQEAEPTRLQTGWIWIRESTLTAKISLFGKLVLLVEGA